MSKTISEIAREAGVSRSTVSRILSGTYTGAADTITLVQRALGGSATPEQPFKSTGQEVILSILNFTLQDKELSLIFGESGVGKTWCALEFQRTHPEVVYYKAMLSESVGGMLSGLCALMALPEHGTISHKIRRIRKGLAGRMLIVDEADLLVGDDKIFLRKLDIFREFYESGAPVALVGLPKLYQGISGANQTYVYSRIGYFRQVDAPSDDELTQFATLKGLTGENAVYASSASSGHGYFRYITKLAKRAEMLDGDVKAASTLMFVGGRG